MHIYEKLEDNFHRNQKNPIVLTIGNFDGMHRGHRAVLKKAKLLAGQEGQVIVLTFRNHPSEVLRPEQPVQLLCSLSHKLLLLEQFGIESTILLPFTRYLAEHSARSFVEQVRQFLPFSDLVLGFDATLGRDRQGDRSTMLALGMEWGFNVHYLEEYRYEGKAVSSTRVREALKQGDLEQVGELLDRPYSIYGSVMTGAGKGKILGFPTANIEVAGLCLPPLGVYAVNILYHSELLQGIANLGTAPTVRKDGNPVLEVHLFDHAQDLVGQKLEVIFKKFIRPEKKFDNIDELKQQIRMDINQSLEFF